MTSARFRIPASLALFAFLGCSVGSVLVVDNIAPREAVAQDVDEGYFYANLAPHGQWFFQADFGWVWHPARVGVGWRPYTEGQWVWATDVGWTWASQEPWGWATYHYGRWYFDPYNGWSWVPGRTWAPAWVSWRVQAGYIGWAPLWPAYFDRYPDRRWDNWHHDHDWDRRHNGRDWDRWVFTRDRDFTSDRVGRMAISDRRQRDSIYSQSRDVTRFDDGHPERRGYSIDRRQIERAVGHSVREVQIETADKPVDRTDTRGDKVRMFRPKVSEAKDKTPDRLGFAKEPTRQARETDTIRQEKERLDKNPDKTSGKEDRGDRNRRDPATGQTPGASKNGAGEKGAGKNGTDRQPTERPDAADRGGKAPQAKQDREPQAKQDRAPQAKQDREPQAKQDRAPQAKQDRAPQQKQDREPQAKQDRAPQQQAPQGQSGDPKSKQSQQGKPAAKGQNPEQSDTQPPAAQGGHGR